jgi:hypothetical protein
MDFFFFPSASSCQVEMREIVVVEEFIESDLSVYAYAWWLGSDGDCERFTGKKKNREKKISVRSCYQG